LGPMFRQVVGTIFSLMIHLEPLWSKVKYSRPTAIYGFGLGEVEMPPKVEVNTQNLLNKFQEGVTRYHETWKAILTEDVHQKVMEIMGMQETEFDFPTDLWARVLFDMAVAFKDEILDRGEIMDSLIPLYFGKTLSFVRKTRRMSIKQAEETIEEDCLTFEMAKPYLLRRWQEK